MVGGVCGQKIEDHAPLGHDPGVLIGEQFEALIN